MAQPTVTARPATWAGTSAPILYKFTSTNYSNAGYYMAVEIWNSTTAAKIADAKYYANSTGVVTVDVAPFLKSAMSLDNTSDLSSGTVYTDGNWVKYYIKYREYWTASSESQVDDVSNLRYAIYGGLQLGSANDFIDYVDVKLDFLTLSSACKAITGYPFLISFVNDDDFGFFRAERFSNSASLGVTDTDISSIGNAVCLARFNESGSADRVDFTLVNENDNSASSTKTVFINGITTDSNNEIFPWGLPGGVVPSLTYDYTATIDATYNSGDSATVALYYLFFDGTAQTIFNVQRSSLGTSSVSGVAMPTPTKQVKALSFFTSIVNAPPDSNQKLASITINGLVDGFITVSETKTVTIQEDCSNTIMLTWRNSLGGWESFPFTINQEYTWHYSDRKAKRLTLYADNLTLSQWEAIQGLNTLGDLYRSPITEMTTSLNRTSATIGQSVYVLNSDGSKIGVNVIGQANTTQTKQKTHSAFVTIEYPELFLQ